MSRDPSQSDDLHVAESHCGVHVDFGFLTAQTFGDRELTRDLLQLFLVQARRLLPTLPAMGPREQGDTAHLLKGSCRGIGAWVAAEAAQRYEDAIPRERAALYPSLAAAFAETETVILTHLTAQ